MLFGHGFDNRELFITYMYFFPLPYTFFPWISGILLRDSLKCRGGPYFLDSICSLNIFLFLKFGLVFENSGLFITCMDFSHLPITFFHDSGKFSLLVHKSTRKVHFSGYHLLIQFFLVSFT